MQRPQILELVLRQPGELHVAVCRADLNADPLAIKDGQGILEADPELADDEVRVRELLGVLVLGEMLVSQATTEVADMPDAVSPADLWFGGSAQRSFVEGVGDDLANRVRRRPVFENTLNVEIKGWHLS
ncbi:MAG: hypothetical protein M0Z49_00765 [Chloroflexi bacterium]|nr:hypothetical protein [Chloroflexota bacterium]